jgi:hypothetical protein
VSDTVSREPITCASCEYRYPSSEQICPMCGKAAPAVEPIRPLSSAPDGFNVANCEFPPSSSNSQMIHMPGFKRLIPVVVVLIVCAAVTHHHGARHASWQATAVNFSPWPQVVTFALDQKAFCKECGQDLSVKEKPGEQLRQSRTVR